jgi:hypothetical protein
VLGELRTWIALALAITGCGGRVLDGTCTAEDGGGEWSCADASGIPPVVSACPPNFVPVGGACSSAISGGLVGGGGGNLAADCLACGGNGVGTYWTCTGQGWKATGSYSCEP